MLMYARVHFAFSIARASSLPRSLRFSTPCYGSAMIPGEVLVDKGEIELNQGRETIRITVANSGDRPVQVGSHYHFFEVNEALQFERKQAYGYRLNIAAGTAVRFEPWQERSVELVSLVGERKVYGFNGKVMGALK